MFVARCLPTLVACFLFTCPQLALAQSTGLVFADDESYRSIPLAATPLLGTLPQSIDMSDRFPLPGNQGNQGSCVGWAIAYALKSYQENDERRWGVESHQTQFSPSYIYNQVKRGADCQGGSVFIDALNLLRREGVATLVDFPYDASQCSALPNNTIRSRAREFSVADWRRVNVQDETEVKSQIASGFPVLIGLEVDQEFKNLAAGNYSEYSGNSLGGHAVVVIGYDDVREAFKIINSWGSNWGDNGYGWIAYSAFRAVVLEGYVVQDIVLNPVERNAETNNSQDLDRPPPPIPEPTVLISQVFVQHNVPVPTPNGQWPGMRIQVSGEIANASGRSLTAQVHFFYANGPSLFANPQEFTFRDVSGQVATAYTATVGSNAENLGQLQLSIPYYALNFAPSNGFNRYNLSVVVSISLDGNLVGQSQSAFFFVNY